MIVEAAAAFRDFPDWFIKYHWHKVRVFIENDFSNPLGQESLCFDIILFSSHIRYKLSFDTFLKQYEACFENKSDTYYYIANLVKEELMKEINRTLMMKD